MAATAGPSTKPHSSFERWRSSMSIFTGMGLTSDAKRGYAPGPSRCWKNAMVARSSLENGEGPRAHAEVETSQVTEEEYKRLEASWKSCESMKKEVMETSPIVVFMLKHLRLAGCPFPSSAIQCHDCEGANAGGFAPEFGVLLCQDTVMNKGHMEDTIAHELIHAYDHCRFKMDWFNLRHQACSEIRAANLSGDCSWGRERERHFYAFNKQHQVCVKRRAILSILGNPSCKSPEMAEKVVNEVWDSCFKDTRPFDEIY